MLPLVQILSPSDSQNIAEASPLTLSGTATDAEDGSLSPSLEWSSDKDGVLGTGASLNVASLSTGLHVISATSTDGGGGIGVARITLQVGTPTPLGSYSHNALGQRVIKTDEGSGNTTHFIYDIQGRVIAEIDVASGATLREYLYVNGQQVAVVDDTGTANEAIYFVHNDHLGTPLKITDMNQSVVWAANYEPFGKADVTVSAVEHNIRFPGQYADGETGLHYNYFRDYDPGTGRYVESDPIGLGGGLNTYGYVNGNPLIYIDPNGERGYLALFCGAVALASNTGNMFDIRDVLKRANEIFEEIKKLDKEIEECIDETQKILLMLKREKLKNLRADLLVKSKMKQANIVISIAVASATCGSLKKLRR